MNGPKHLLIVLLLLFIFAKERFHNYVSSISFLLLPLVLKYLFVCCMPINFRLGRWFVLLNMIMLLFLRLLLK